MAILYGFFCRSVLAEVPRQLRFGASGGRDFECNDGKTYFVKPQRRSNIAEHVVARIGAIIQAPVANIALVKIPQELIDEEPTIANFQPNLTHGSEFIPGLVDSRVVQYTTEQENRVRFARLALLDALTCADDRQFSYDSIKPHGVYSIDHGYYFPGNHNWNASTLREFSAPKISEEMLINATLTEELLSDGVTFLSKLTDQEIANIIFTVPSHWGADEAQKIMLANWLSLRRDVLIRKYVKI